MAHIIDVAAFIDGPKVRLFRGADDRVEGSRSKSGEDLVKREVKKDIGLQAAEAQWALRLSREKPGRVSLRKSVDNEAWERRRVIKPKSYKRGSGYRETMAFYS